MSTERLEDTLRNRVVEIKQKKLYKMTVLTNPGFWLVLTLPITMIGYLHNQTTNFYRRYYYD